MFLCACLCVSFVAYTHQAGNDTRIRALSSLTRFSDDESDGDDAVSDLSDVVSDLDCSLAPTGGSFSGVASTSASTSSGAHTHTHTQAPAHTPSGGGVSSGVLTPSGDWGGGGGTPLGAARRTPKSRMRTQASAGAGASARTRSG